MEQSKGNILTTAFRGGGPPPQLVQPIYEAMEGYADVKVDVALHKERNDIQAKFSEQAKEYASKLHLLQQENERLKAYIDTSDEVLQDKDKNELRLLQQEYDKLHADHHEIEQQANSLRDAYDNKAIQHQQLKDEYDKLKMQSELNYEVLVSECKALKERADKMDAVLTSIASSPIPANEWENFSWIETARRLASEALSADNSNTNQNENNG